MFRFNLRAALIALTAIAAFALPASALATNVTRWSIQQPSIDPNSDQAPYASVPTILLDPYVQANPAAGFGPMALDDSNEDFGISLNWGGWGSQWKFIRQPGTYLSQQIAAGQRVALFNTQSDHYLAEGNQTFGINLVWSTTPRYEWQVAKGGDSSHPYWADLYNTTEQAYLIDYYQVFGVNLGWIHAPFETGPDYIPPTQPVSTGTQPVSGSPPPAK